MLAASGTVGGNAASAFTIVEPVMAVPAAQPTMAAPTAMPGMAMGGGAAAAGMAGATTLGATGALGGGPVSADPQFITSDPPVAMPAIAPTGDQVLYGHYAAPKDAKGKDKGKKATGGGKDSGKEVTVKKGDTLKEIAKRNDVSVKQLHHANKDVIGTKPKVAAGQVLEIPGSKAAGKGGKGSKDGKRA